MKLKKGFTKVETLWVGGILLTFVALVLAFITRSRTWEHILAACLGFLFCLLLMVEHE